jgi:regulator of G-protein signaling
LVNDEQFWKINAATVSHPSKMRVTKWSFSFKELLSDPTGVEQFLKFCETEFTAESLKFYQACQAVKDAPMSQLSDKVKNIVK